MAEGGVRVGRREVLAAAGGSAALLFGGAEGRAEGPAHGRLPRAHPEAVGIDPGGVAAFVEAVEQRVGGLHSLMLLRQGRVAAEGWWAPYGPRHPHMLYSLSKSFTSTAVGLAVAEGRLTVDERVISFLPESLPPTIGPNLKAMRVRHLLSMSTGHERDATGPTTAAADGNWVRAFLALPVEHPPGSRFVYNSAATYMLSAIVQKLTGQRVLDYLRPRLFDPLGIPTPTWEQDPRGIDVGGWGLDLRTEDIARFGQLYLQRGSWEGRRLVPESWVAEATTRQVANGTNPNSDWNQGYGYQFWRCRHGAYRGDGAFGQYCVVMPEQQAVLAITSGLGDMQAVLNAAWDHLLPAMKGEVGAPGESGALRRRLRSLTVAPPRGEPASPTAARVTGREIRLEKNPEGWTAAVARFGREGCTLELRGDGETPVRFRAGAEEWAQGAAPLLLGALTAPRPAARVAGRGAWTDPDTYEMKLCFYETPYVLTATLKFDGQNVTVRRRMNVGFGPTERPTLTGRLT